MTDINKTIRKIAGNHRNALTVYTEDDILAGLAENFDTVFALSNNRNIKGRNIVYREHFKDMDLMSGIGIVLINPENLESLRNLKELLAKTRAPLIIFDPEYIPTDYAKLLKSYKYELVDLRKTFQIWNHKR